MMTQDFLTQDIFLISAVALTLALLNALVLLGLYGRMNKNIAKNHLHTQQAVSRALNTLRDDINTIGMRQSAEESLQTTPAVNPTQKRFEKAIALAEIGVSSENIARETGLSEIDISAIVRFHSKQAPTPAKPLT